MKFSPTVKAVMAGVIAMAIFTYAVRPFADRHFL